MEVIWFADTPKPERLDRSQALSDEEMTWER